MQLLTTRQYKLDKGIGSGYLTAGITLAPAGEAATTLGITLPSVCAYSGACGLAEIGGCLVHTGMNSMPTHARARALRTQFWYQDRPAFLRQVFHEFGAVERKAAREGFDVAFRPNVLSDLPVMARAIATALPHVKVYDYTKIPPAKWSWRLKNYTRTYSVSERTTPSDIRAAFKRGANCAVVVDVRKGDPIPATFTVLGVTRPTIDGDLDDLRFTDESDHYVILRWKGSRARLVRALAAGWALTVPTP
jgi:hypothetical protein